MTKMGHDLARIRARLFNAPLFVMPDVATTIAANLGERLAPHSSSVIKLDIADGDGPDQEDLYDFANGVATIRVHGELVNRGSWLNSISGLTSYEGLARALKAAESDPKVTGIALDIDSPGGEAAGAMETASLIRQVAQTKPVVAIANSLAASAAYALAAGATKIVLPPSGMVGSIGVVMLHMDRSKMLEEYGLKPTLLHAGAYKVDGNELQPLPDEARGRLQDTIETYYDLFVSSVGAHRPDLGEKGARKTEAGIFIGQKAIDAGLADEIGDLESVVKDLRSRSPEGTFGLRAGAKAGKIEMAVKLYHPGEAHADSLIGEGKVDHDSAWSFSAEDGDKLLGASGDDWSNYAKFHLGEDDGENEKTKGRYKYPYGKDGKVFRHGLIAAKDRAGQEGAKDIEAAAGRLLEKIDKDKEKKAAMDQAQIDAARADGMKAGAKQERDRISAIVRAEAAEGRAATALSFALDTSMSAEEAVVALGSVPKAAPAPAAPAASTDAPRGPKLDNAAPRFNLQPNVDPGEGPKNDTEKGAAAFAAALGRPSK